MGIAGITDSSRTALSPGTKGKNFLFRILLRRLAQITPKEIDKIKREELALETIQWSPEAIEFYLWFPYKAPEEAITPGAPRPPKSTGTPITK
jgi:hypothetical protein